MIQRRPSCSATAAVTPRPANDPLTIDEVAVDHPKVTFVIPMAAIPGSAAEVVYRNPNVYLDAQQCSPGTWTKYRRRTLNLRRSTDRVDIRLLEDPKKLMFGTDWPLVSMKPYVEAYKRAFRRTVGKLSFTTTQCGFKVDGESR